MRCPTLKDLPPPPEGKTGWPWTEETPQLPDRMPDGSPWPQISIVTPSYNQGQFIEETIRSVLLQGYPNLEYIVMDGGSSDGTIDIIRKYEKWISYWQSGPDSGQVEAINSGLDRSSGEILNWLNSDDFLLEGALYLIALGFCSVPEADVFVGSNISVWNTANRRKLYRCASPMLDRPWAYRYGIAGVPQDGTYFSRRVWELVGPLDSSLEYCFDTKFFEELLPVSRYILLSNWVISSMNRHLAQKTTRNFCSIEPERIKKAPVRMSIKYFVRRLLKSRYSAVLCTLFPRLLSKEKMRVKIFDPEVVEEWDVLKLGFVTTNKYNE